MKADFHQSRRLLKWFDKHESRRNKLFESAETDADIAAAVALRTRHEDAVKVAFFLDTKKFNSRENCMITTLDFIRKCSSGIQSNSKRDEH